MRKILLTAGLILAAVAASSDARAEGGGQVGCSIDLQQVSKEVDAKSGQLPQATLHNLQQRLDVMASHCNQGGDADAGDAAMIRQILASSANK